MFSKDYKVYLLVAATVAILIEKHNICDFQLSLKYDSYLHEVHCTVDTNATSEYGNFRYIAKILLLHIIEDP